MTYACDDGEAYFAVEHMGILDLHEIWGALLGWIDLLSLAAGVLKFG